MAEDNQNNQGAQGNSADDTALPSETAPDSANSASSSAAPGGTNNGTTPKKPKTEKQIERERERRRRRRKKKAEMGGVGTPGPNLPINGDKTSQLRPANRLPPIEYVPPVVPPIPVTPEPVSEISAVSFDEVSPTTSPELPPVESTPELPPAEVSQVPPAAYPEQLPTFVESPELPPAGVFPVPPAPALTPELSPDDTAPEPPVEEPSEPPNDNLIEAEPVHEESFEKINQDKARELHETLLSDQLDHLEELPVKQGLLGRFFDKFAELVQGRKSPGLPSSMGKKTETIVTEVSEKPDVSGISSFLANLIKFLIVIALIIGAFWLGSSLKLVDRLSGLFVPGSGGGQLAVGDNSKVVIDPQMLQKFGFETARLIGNNLGDSNDLTYNIFFNADYFGKLKEPVVYGETGISAAIYYGLGREVQYAQNRFIAYVQYLSSVVNANSVRIADVLKTNARRDIALDNYLKQSQDIFDRGNTYRKEINVQIDDLQVSLDTLLPDKTRYQTDFFASMAAYDGEKANALLAQFIDAGQTNVGLTAKQNALKKLTENYQTELLKLQTRIQAVRANRDALISGVAFTELSSGGITLITQ